MNNEQQKYTAYRGMMITSNTNWFGTQIINHYVYNMIYVCVYIYNIRKTEKNKKWGMIVIDICSLQKNEGYDYECTKKSEPITHVCVRNEGSRQREEMRRGGHKNKNII